MSEALLKSWWVIKALLVYVFGRVVGQVEWIHDKIQEPICPWNQVPSYMVYKSEAMAALFKGGVHMVQQLVSWGKRMSLFTSASIAWNVNCHAIGVELFAVEFEEPYKDVGWCCFLLLILTPVFLPILTSSHEVSISLILHGIVFWVLKWALFDADLVLGHSLLIFGTSLQVW